MGQIREEDISNFREYLNREERSKGTIEKYLRDVKAFGRWLGERAVNKEAAVAWKEYLITKGYAPVTVNSMVSSLNTFFRFMGYEGYRVKFLKIQRKTFRDREKELDREEYGRLLKTAGDLHKRQLLLIMETICATGIRVSEIKYMTLEAARAGRADIYLKGKVRTILLPDKLRQKLQQYAARENITSGEIFLTKKGKSISRRQIWREMKGLCEKAGVAPKKVFPHNLRHLFAVTFHKTCGDIVKLADVLGHSSIETTRIYLATTVEEHTRYLNSLGLVSRYSYKEP